VHRHDRGDEAFYLLEGGIQIDSGDKRWRAGPGDFVFLSRGIPHAFMVSDGPVRGLQITAPVGFERFIAELGRPAEGPRLPAPGAAWPAHADRGEQEIRDRTLGSPPG
jgi:Cupin domain